jgi:hypothetical protein
MSVKENDKKNQTLLGYAPLFIFLFLFSFKYQGMTMVLQGRKYEQRKGKEKPQVIRREKKEKITVV